MNKIGIDVGGSHIGMAVLDKNNNIIKRYSMENNKKIKYEDFLKYIEEIYKANQYIEYVGIGLPGMVNSKNGLITKCMNSSFESKNIIEDLSKVGIVAKVDNDVNCIAKAELVYGNLQGINNALVIAAGTGIGGSIISDGKVYYGNKGNAGEIGHIVIDKEGILCSCGRRGCYQEYASKRVLKDMIKQSVLNVTTQEFLKLYLEDYSKTKYIVDKYMEHFEIGLRNLINIFDPECILIGGGFSEYPEFEKIIKSKIDYIDIRMAKFKNDAGILGSILD